ncbi:hypothetical protein [Janthinobacterium sp. JC611]
MARRLDISRNTVRR